MPLSPQQLDLARQIVALYEQKGKMIALAESCTGGGVASALTDVAGASAVFDRGFVTYSNAAKVDLLGVLPDTLATYGAVSAQTAEEMAKGALTYSLADVAVAVTGIAGPDGGSPQKPVGTVFFGVALRKKRPEPLPDDEAPAPLITVFHEHCAFAGERETIRAAATAEALRLLLAAAEG